MAGHELALRARDARFHGPFLATTAFVVLPLSIHGLGVLVLALGFGLPLAAVGWFLQTTFSAEVSLLGAFVGLHALAAGGIAGAVWTRTSFFGFSVLLCLGFGIGGFYGAVQQTSWSHSALVLAPFTLVGWGGAAAMWRPTPPRRQQVRSAARSEAMAESNLRD